MADEKLTVAELLARAGKSGGDATDHPRRRRRRFVEDGGISVAELTGSLPAVDAQPKTSRHSEPIDGPDDASNAAADEAVASAVAAHEQASAAQATILAEARKQASAGRPQHENKLADTTTDEQSAAQADRDSSKQSATPVARTSGEPSAHDDGRGADSDATDEPDKTTDASSAPAFEVQVVSENEMGPLTTGTIPVVTDEHIAKDKAEAAAHEAEADTVTDTATDSLTQAANDDDEVAAHNAPAKHDTHTPTPLQRSAAYPVADADETAVHDVAPADENAPAEADEPSQPEKVSIVGIVVLAILALAIGVAIFNGFELLWRYVNHWISLALAILVTLGIVGCVHALRAEKDKLSMFLAALAGLAVTFGPLAIVGL